MNSLFTMRIRSSHSSFIRSSSFLRQSSSLSIIRTFPYQQHPQQHQRSVPFSTSCLVSRSHEAIKYNTKRYFSKQSELVKNSQEIESENVKKEETKEGQDQTFANILLFFVGACLIVYAVFYENKNEPKLLEEHESKSKYDADSLIDEIPNNGNIKRIQQKHRLPLSTLDENGIKHGRLEGTKWIETNGDYFIQTYWNDEAAYEFSLDAITTLRNASWELHHMCLEAVDLVVNSDELMDIFEIPPNMRSSIRESWHSREPDLLGRFDFSWDGIGNPKLLEYNADTPTVLVESSLGQKLWFEYVTGMSPNSEMSQFNELHSRLIESWKYYLPIPSSSSSTSSTPIELIFLEQRKYERTIEDIEHQNYVNQAAFLAGIPRKSMNVQDLIFELEKYKEEEEEENLFFSSNSRDIDIDDDDDLKKKKNLEIIEKKKFKPIRYLWKSYPYEYLAGKPLGELLFGSMESNDFSYSSSNSMKKLKNLHLIEPSWKIILGNKAILTLLWELYPNHPYLLYSSYDHHEALHDAIHNNYSLISKPKYGREGSGIHIHQYDKLKNNKEEFYKEINENNLYSNENYIGENIFQEYHPIHRFQGRNIVIGSWIIRGKPAGICVREDVSLITNDNSSIVPHYINSKRNINTTSSSNAHEIYSPIFSHSLPSLPEKQQRLRYEFYPEEKEKEVKKNGSNRGTGGGGGGSWWWWRTDNQGSNSSKNNTTSSSNTSGSNSTTSGPGGSQSTTGTSSTASNSTSSKEDAVRSKAKSYHQKRWAGSTRAAHTGVRRFGNGIGRGSS